MKFVVIIFSLIISGQLLAANKQIRDLKCTAVNALGSSEMTYSPTDRSIEAVFNNGRRPLTLTGVYYVATSVQGVNNDQPIMSSIAMESPSESNAFNRVAYTMIFNKVAQSGKVNTMKGTLQRVQGFGIPIKTVVATLSCELTLQ